MCCYDQANGNAVLGVARAKEAGFDMCHFNLHKTFSSPHGCSGPACGATGVVEKLIPFLPVPAVEFDGKKYYLDESFADKKYGVSKVREFMGVAPVVLRAYCWIRMLGPNGLWQATKTAVLNNNYLFKRMMSIPRSAIMRTATINGSNSAATRWSRSQRIPESLPAMCSGA